MGKTRQWLAGLLAALTLAGCACFKTKAPAVSAPVPTAAPTATAVPAPTPAPTPGSPARQLALSVEQGGKKQPRLADGEPATKVTFRQDATVTVTADEPFAGLYLIFDRPVEWQLETGAGESQLRGEQGFLHEYVELETPAAVARLLLPAGTTLCSVQAFTAGALPDWVQVWQAPCQRADLLVLPTHADDEHLWFGGALPYYAGERGLAVQVAYMTNHWAEPYRPHELLNGLWTVGVRNYPVISDFPDLYASKASLESAKRVYDEEAVTAWQVELLRRFKPSVVLGHDINGEYGHGAHQLNAATLLAALECSADPEQYPESARLYGPWQVDKCYLHLWPENTIQMEWGQMPLSAFGGRTALEMAAAGFACHASQTLWFSVKASGANDCRKFGLAYTNVGPDEEKNDFFEHIELSQ